MPLVEDITKVLDERARAAEQAKTRAADLAQGLKTPLTANEVMVDELRSEGEIGLGSELSEYVATMQRHVERELARERSALITPSHKPVLIFPVVQGLVRSLKRLANGKVIQSGIAIDPAMAVTVDEALLTEVLGNLLGNARKWANSRVSISARIRDNAVEFGVDGDGPGVIPDAFEDALRSGRRLDEAVPGTGFALAIANDMLEEVEDTLTCNNQCSAHLGCAWCCRSMPERSMLRTTQVVAPRPAARASWLLR
ncbi:MAG: sensor histidine kinase [Hyphomicrobiaceae bacterium]